MTSATVSAARAAGVKVSVCGESASDPVLAFLWTALGVDSLSMSAGFIPPVRRMFRALGPADAADLAAAVRAGLDDSSAEEMYEMCRSFLLSRLPERGSFEALIGRPGA